MVDGQYKMVIDQEATTLELAKVMKIVGKCEKEYTDTYFVVTSEPIPGVKFVFQAGRQVACTKRVVGTEVIPAVSYPATTREIVEWDCEKISFLSIDTD